MVSWIEVEQKWGKASDPWRPRRTTGEDLGDDGEWSQWRRWATGVVFASKLNIDRGRGRKMPVSHEEISFRQDGKSQRVKKSM